MRKKKDTLPKFYAYTAIIERDGEFWMVRFPDLERCMTDTKTMEDAFIQAGNILEDYMALLERDGFDIPEPTPFEAVEVPEGGRKQYVVVPMSDARRRWENKSVNRMVTLPAWLDQKGRDAGVNFSQLLQAALSQELGV